MDTMVQMNESVLNSCLKKNFILAVMQPLLVRQGHVVNRCRLDALDVILFDGLRTILRYECPSVTLLNVVPLHMSQYRLERCLDVLHELWSAHFWVHASYIVRIEHVNYI